MDFLNTYGHKKEIIEKNLYKYLPDSDKKSQTLLDSMNYSLQAGGKRLRPVLLMASCEFCGGNPNDAIPFACAVEMIHTYSLIHDDLPAMDDDDYRRGKLSNHKVFGEAAAILAGDGLLNTAMEIICSEVYKTVEDVQDTKRKILAAKEIFSASGCNGMIGGQIADIESEGKVFSEDMLDFIHTKKTAALLIASVKAGALLGSADDDTLADLVVFAKNMGLAFQIIDDILDICGNQELLGKSTGSDEKLNKLTYPSLYGIEESKNQVKTLNNHSLKILDKYREKSDFFKNLLIHLADRSF